MTPTTTVVSLIFVTTYIVVPDALCIRRPHTDNPNDIQCAGLAQTVCESDAYNSVCIWSTTATGLATTGSSQSTGTTHSHSLSPVPGAGSPLSSFGGSWGTHSHTTSPVAGEGSPLSSFGVGSGGGGGFFHTAPQSPSQSSTESELHTMDVECVPGDISYNGYFATICGKNIYSGEHEHIRHHEGVTVRQGKTVDVDNMRGELKFIDRNHWEYIKPRPLHGETHPLVETYNDAQLRVFLQKHIITKYRGGHMVAPSIDTDFVQTRKGMKLRRESSGGSSLSSLASSPRTPGSPPVIKSGGHYHWKDWDYPPVERSESFSKPKKGHEPVTLETMEHAPGLVMGTGMEPRTIQRRHSETTAKKGYMVPVSLYEWVFLFVVFGLVCVCISGFGCVMVISIVVVGAWWYKTKLNDEKDSDCAIKNEKFAMSIV